MSETRGRIFEFSGFRLEADERRLSKDGRDIALPAKAFDLLTTLIEEPGHLVTKKELYERLWGEQFVEDANLTVQVSNLRRALGDADLIKTVKGHGYRFTADVRAVGEGHVGHIVQGRRYSRLTIEQETEQGTPTDSTAAATKAPARRSNKRVLLTAAAAVVSVIVGTAGYFGLKTWQRRSAFENIGELRIEKLTASGKITVAEMSPNGEFVIFAQKEGAGESLWLGQTQTGIQQRIVEPKALQYVGLTVTPDNDHVYCVVFYGNRSDPELWKVPILGGPTRTISDVITGTSVTFSPDGKRFAFSSSHSPLSSLWIADADGRNQRPLISGDGVQRSVPVFETRPAAWTPDGREIACVVEEMTPDGKRAGVVLADAESGQERWLAMPRWAFVGEIAWLDNETLTAVVYEKSESNSQIFTISRGTGEVGRITNDISLYRWVSTANGRLAAVKETSNTSLLVAEADAAASGCDKGPAGCNLQIKELFNGTDTIGGPDWALDGSILYSSPAGDQREIWRIPAFGGDPVQLTAGSLIDSGLSVSPADGSLAISREENGRRSIWLAGPDGNGGKQLTPGPEDLWAVFAPDGQSVYFQRGFNNSPKSIWRVTTANGEETRLTEKNTVHPQVSPDGKTIAYFSMDSARNAWRIGLAAADSGIQTGSVELPEGVTHRRLQWHPSGRFVIVGYRSGETARLMALPVDGSAPIPVTDAGKGEISGFSISRDGRRIAVAVTEKIRDIIVISRTPQD